jgi:hypothetical protein
MLTWTSTHELWATFIINRHSSDNFGATFVTLKLHVSTLKNSASATIFRLDDLLAFTVAKRHGWWIAWFSNASKSCWATTLGSFELGNAVDLFTLAFSTVWFFKNWTSELVFTSFARQVFTSWATFTFDSLLEQVFSFRSGIAWFALGGNGFWDETVQTFLFTNVTFAQIF